MRPIVVRMTSSMGSRFAITALVIGSFITKCMISNAAEVNPLIPSAPHTSTPDSPPPLPVLPADSAVSTVLSEFSIAPGSVPISGDNLADRSILLDQIDQTVSAEQVPIQEQAIEPVAQSTSSASESLDLDPSVIENSPVLQRWLRQIPDVQSDIRNDPSFRTRIRLGYSNFPSSEDASGLNIGIEDVFIGHTGLTVSADYQTAFEHHREAYGSEVRYYVLPLGSTVNLAPVAGYRRVEGDRYSTSGINLGLRLLLSLSRTGAADVSVSQSFVAPGTNDEVGITTFSFGYALTPQLRISTDLQKQNAPQQKDSRFGVSLEWML